MAQRNVGVEDITKRFGVVDTGVPRKINASGITTLYTPSLHKRMRLKWFAAATPDTNSAGVVMTLRIGLTDVYIWPLGTPGAFMHSSVREGELGESLTIELTSAEDVYVNMDINEF